MPSSPGENQPAEQSRPSLRTTRTRAALLAAGLQLLADKPVDAIAIDELVAAAGVAKGSFFNHFADKNAFAAAVADDIRAQFEARVDRFNAVVEDPLARLSGGLVVAAAFAMREPRRTIVLARSANSQTLEDHPLNRGVVDDMRAARRQRQVGDAADRAGVLFWLGCGQTLMGAIVASAGDRSHASDVLEDIVQMGLRGLGADANAIDHIIDDGALRARLDDALERFDW